MGSMFFFGVGPISSVLQDSREAKEFIWRKQHAWRTAVRMHTPHD